MEVKVGSPAGSRGASPRSQQRGSQPGSPRGSASGSKRGSQSGSPRQRAASPYGSSPYGASPRRARTPVTTGQKFSAARTRRMATETDVQLMANRLAKLRADEARAQRKVEEMRRKADQVVATKHRNFRKYQMKYQHVAAEYEVLQQRAEKQRSEREVHAKNVSEAMLKVGEGKRLAAAAARKELKEGRAFAERGKTEHIMRARQNRDRIRNSHGDTSKWKSKQAATLTTAIEEDAQQRLAGEEVRIEKNISKLTSAQQEEERLIANLCKIQQEELGAAAELGAALSYDPFTPEQPTAQPN